MYIDIPNLQNVKLHHDLSFIIYNNIALPLIPFNYVRSKSISSIV